MDQSDQNQWKKSAAEAAAQLVQDGMVVGLGTGSTAAFFVNALAERISREGLRASGIPTSQQTAELARSLNVPLATFTEHPELDLTVDGADEIELGTLYLIKGHGGALLREKIVAAASKRVVIVADETKLVERLGSLYPVPVEVVQFGWEVTDKRLQKLGAITSLRRGADAKPFLTDCGNYIIDCAFGPMNKPKEIAHHLDHVVGSVEHGLFLGFASQVFIGGREGMKVLERETATPES
ncbi:MAG TPA: ribose-5-phosphate isomerase RpiA [Candidatus Acidoferrales bacterium]|nr:ribose-5-phosphate isomerase RpiA [Candidatus Acidoferrales bacterium]